MIGALMELMNHYYQSGNVAQLGIAARTLLDAVPDDIVSAHFLAVAYLKTGRAGDARRVFERLRDCLPVLMQRLRPPMGAVQPAQLVCLSEATVRNPDYASNWRALASEVGHLGCPAEAVAMLRLAVAARPDDIQALRQLGRLGLTAADPDAAEAGYRGLLAQHPDDAEAVNGLARALELRLAQRAGTVRVSSASATTSAEDRPWQTYTNSRRAASTAATSPSATTPDGSC